MRSASNLVKRGFERLVIGSGTARRARRSQMDSIAIIAYHNVVGNGAPVSSDVSLHMPLNRFRAHVERLLRTHEVVDPRHDFEPRTGGRPLAAITFDDGYHGAVRHALPFLAERGIPATVFLCPGLIGSPAFWWDRLAGPRGLDPSVRKAAFQQFGGREGAIVEALGVGSVHGGDLAAATLPELRAATYPGLTYASHTWSHPSLPTLDDRELRDEFEKPLRWAAEHLPDGAWSDRHLAFPYGHWDDRVAHTAAACGYTRLYRVDGGLADRQAWGEPCAVLPRINVPRGLSPDGLELRMAGVFG